MLEVAVQENTVALRELIALLKGGAASAAPTAATAPAAPAAPAAAAPRTRKPAETKTDPAPAEPEKAAAPTTYEQAAKAVTSLIQRKGKPAALAVLEKFEAKKLPDIKPERFADVVSMCEAEA